MSIRTLSSFKSKFDIIALLVVGKFFFLPSQQLMQGQSFNMFPASIFPWLYAEDFRPSKFPPSTGSYIRIFLSYHTLAYSDCMEDLNLKSVVVITCGETPNPKQFKYQSKVQMNRLTTAYPPTPGLPAHPS